MNYAAMIEEKHLKKGFIIATLISTVVGTFTTSMGLYERVRDRHMQHKKDHGQDEKIKELERRADDADRKRQNAEREKDDHIRGRGRGRRSRSRALEWDERDLLDELATSGPMIRREYDRNYARFGSRFAEGDQIAQNELQAQVIEMQATVIRLLQEALVNGSKPDLAALYSAAGRARNGSIRALNDQYQRMLTAAPVSSRNGTVYIPGSGNTGTGRRALRSSSLASASTRSSYAEPVDRDRRRFTRDYGDDEDDRDLRRCDMDRQRRSMSQATAGTRRASTFPMQPTAAEEHLSAVDALPGIVASQPPLFCRYSVQLQKDWRRPLALGIDDSGSSGRSHFIELDFDGKSDGDLVCPACMGSFAIEHGRSWKMHKPVVVGEEIQEVKETDVQDDGVDKDETTAGHDGDHADNVVKRRKNIVELVQDRLFVVSNRFIVKCHRPAAYDGLENTLLPPSFACSLCDQFDPAGKVTLCSTMARLVNHVCEKHSVGELLSDPDIREIRR